MDEKLSDHPPTPKPAWEMDAADMLVELIELRARIARLDKKGTSNLPRLTPRSVARYVAAVTSELAAGRLEPAAARTCLYAAQLMLSFTPKK